MGFSDLGVFLPFLCVRACVCAGSGRLDGGGSSEPSGSLMSAPLRRDGAGDLTYRLYFAFVVRSKLLSFLCLFFLPLSPSTSPIKFFWSFFVFYSYFCSFFFPFSLLPFFFLFFYPPCRPIFSSSFLTPNCESHSPA